MLVCSVGVLIELEAKSRCSYGWLLAELAVPRNPECVTQLLEVMSRLWNCWLKEESWGQWKSKSRERRATSELKLKLRRSWHARIGTMDVRRVGVNSVVLVLGPCSQADCCGVVGEEKSICKESTVIPAR